MSTCTAYGLLHLAYTKAKAVSYKYSLDLLSQVVVVIPSRFFYFILFFMAYLVLA